MSAQRRGGPPPEPLYDPDREGDNEVALHVELLVNELMAGGLSREDAVQEARRRFGDEDAARRASRAMARRHETSHAVARAWSGLRDDVRQTVRRLLGQPGYTGTVVATFTLGLGAVALIGSLVWGVLLRPLPFPEPGRLVSIWQDNRVDGRPEDLFSPANYLDLRANAASLEELGARLFYANALTLETEGAPQTVLAQRATPSFLHALRTRPVVGRLFTEQEGEVGSSDVVLLAHAFWRERFAGAPDVAGRTLVLDGRRRTVVGVLPPAMRSLNPGVQLWVPLAWHPQVHFSMAPDQRAIGILHLVGRLAPESAPEGARAELEALSAMYPDANTGKGVTMRGLRDELVRGVRPTLLAFGGALALLVLIAAVNVTTLQMSRATVLEPAAAVRRALGAGRLHLLRLSLLESVVPALSAAVLALVGARWVLGLVLALGPAGLPREQEVRVDTPVALAVLALALLLAAVTGVPSALTGLRASPTELSKARGSSGSGTARRIRAALVTAELALSLALLVGAGLLVRSFQAAMREDPGFRHEGLLASYLGVPESRQGSTEDVLVWYQETIEELERLPDVAGVGMVSRVPLEGLSVLTRVDVEGRDVPEGERPQVEFRRAWPGYFELLGVPVLEGRAFGPDDTPDNEPVAVINRAAAEELFPDGGALGRRVRWSPSTTVPPVRIVGVVGDVRHFGLDRPPVAELYVAFSQRPNTAGNVVVRTSGDPAALAGPLRSRLAAMMPGRPMPEVRLMAELGLASISVRRFNALVLAAFAAAAVLLALVGTYGVFSYWVSSRRREMGIRMAMGAGPDAIVRLVMRRSAATVVGGLLLGTVSALLLARARASLLYGIAPTDPLILASAAAVVAGAALGASWLPARRAAGVEPVETLSEE